MGSISRMALLICLFVMVSADSNAESYGGYYSLGAFGARLSNHDLKLMAKAAQPLLEDESLPIGTSREWKNPESGDHGTIQLIRRFEYKYQGSSLPCRELRYHVQTTGDADPYNVKLNRCKVADGSWKTL